MNNKALLAIEKYNLLDNKDKICIALSGGADSVALMHFLFSSRYSLNIEKLYACHLNHCLRGEESQRDENFVRELCKNYEIELFVKKVDINTLCERENLSIELGAREARYKFFSDIHNKYECKIATAHTLSDAMETTVFNMARGTGVRGLSGIAPVRDYIIRPLITSTREDIEDYIEKSNLNYVTDSTNLTDLYTRNRIRHNIIPELYKLNSSTDAAFLRLFSQLKEQEDFISLSTKKAILAIRNKDAFSKIKFEDLHSCIKSQIIIELLREKNISPSGEKIELILSIIKHGGKAQLNSEYFILSNGEYFSVSTDNANYLKSDKSLANVLDMDMGVLEIENEKRHTFTIISYEQIENFKENYNLDLKNLLDYDKIGRSAIIRHKMDGDKIKLDYLNSPKKLKKLFNDKKIPVSRRKELLVLADGDEILWVEDIGYSKKIMVTKDTKQILAVFAEE